MASLALTTSSAAQMAYQAVFLIVALSCLVMVDHASSQITVWIGSWKLVPCALMIFALKWFHQQLEMNAHSTINVVILFAIRMHARNLLRKA